MKFLLWHMRPWAIGLFAAFMVGICVPVLAAEASYVIESESFDREPGWDGFRNQIVPDPPVYARQSFGHSKRTNHAGGETGEIGGEVRRTITPAFYALKIPECGFNDKLTASGKFSLVHCQGNSGLYFGWFNEKRQGFRGENSFALRFNGDLGSGSVTAEYSTSLRKVGGIDPHIKHPADGKPHTWRLEYDPEGNNGNGTILFQLDDMPAITNNLEPGHKAEGAIFNRFGIYNHQVPGYNMLIYFDDITVNGKKYDFSSDPGWEERGSRARFIERDADDAQNFGFSETSYAGGKPGEVGGTFWRTEPSSPAHGYYADVVGPFDMKDKLFASGKVSFTRTSVDSAMFIGWFNSKHFKRPAVDAVLIPDIDHVAALIEGPSRDGHYFRPHSACLKTEQYADTVGPIIPPDGKSYDWTISYDPDANNGNGSITTTFDGKATTMDLPPGIKQNITELDRFGVFTGRCGGHFVTVYFDDLKYTSARK